MGSDSGYVVGIDIGGTFTDLVAINYRNGNIMVGKVLTTPSDPSKGALTGLRDLLLQGGVQPCELSQLVHATTLVTNALIERRGAKTALITTKGFRDVLEIGREKRYDIYDLFIDLPSPLVERFLRKDVEERIHINGEVLQPLDLPSLQEICADLRHQEVESIAICFLHSYLNPSNEIKALAVVREMLPNAYVSLSSEVLPEIREYDRTSTTVANAYVGPTVQKYLGKFRHSLEEFGISGKLHVMLSNGGAARPEVAMQFPIRMLESGPAAGALCALHCGSLLREDRILSYDMGGTTAKICLIDDGKPEITTEFEAARVYRFKKGSGLPVRISVIEMVEIGAGGGSTGWVDQIGLLRVGPKSSGADPGPACYGRGGLEATVTDANLELGYLNADFFLGGNMPLYKERAAESIERSVAQPLGMSMMDAAKGIFRVVNENMANCARVYAAEKGRDLRRYCMVAFGGAGPIHACEVARRLGVGKVVFPPNAGVASALGLLTAPLSFDLVRTHVTLLKDMDLTYAQEMYRTMEIEGIRLLKEAGVDETDILIQRSADMRYQGQEHEINIILPSDAFDRWSEAVLGEAFKQEYEHLFHRIRPEAEIEVINQRIVVSGPKPVITVNRAAVATNTSVALACKGERKVYFPEGSVFLPCSTYDRYLLQVGAYIKGPAIIEEKESTVVVPPNWTIEVDEHLNLVATRITNEGGQSNDGIY